MPSLNLLATLLMAAFYAAHTIASPHAPAVSAAAVGTNDNRASAGSMHGDTLVIALDAREGEYKPAVVKGTPVRILAFGETGKALTSPGPMIRVRLGTKIRARVHNTAQKPLVVHGLSNRHRALPDSLIVPAGETRDATFTADEEGTFFYWASASGTPIDDRRFEDAQLNGAFIVDPKSGAPRPDRVFVIQWTLPHQSAKDTSMDNLNGFFTFNGAPWPSTERLTYAQGDSVHWRFINATADIHPLHLHGFYYRITARGDAMRDTLYWPAQQRMAVTELLLEGTTMDMSWYADRPGGWIFHCHLNFHVFPNPGLGEARLPDSARVRELLSPPDMNDMPGMKAAMANHSETGMGGLVLRMDVKPRADWHPYTGPRERFHLYIQSDSTAGKAVHTFGYVLTSGNEVLRTAPLAWPGPTIVLHKGQPTSIMVVNHAAEPSQVHWHGLEIDSYYDGVAGISRNKSGANELVSPMIMPRDSFEMTVTPPRAGSFMYHTHINDIRQQSNGLYGPIVVLPAGESFDPESDLIFQAATNPSIDPIFNGDTAPPALTLHAGKPYRVRLMNVTLDGWGNEFALNAADGTAPNWTAIAKDGFDLPPWQREDRPARQRVSIGETYDFRITFAKPGEFVMTGHTETGQIYARQVIHVIK